MPWYYAVAERDHPIQNPTSPDKIRRLGERLRLNQESHVLDTACGRGGPALILAETFDSRILGVERAPEFAQVARERIAEANLEKLVEIVEQDALDFEFQRGAFDVAMCLGASFIWDSLAGTLAAIAPAVRPGGHVVVGEPYWRRWPLPRGVEDEGYTTLAGTTQRFEAAGLAVVGLIASSEDDWDEYESLHWCALEEWLAENPADPDAQEIRRLHEESRDRYLRWQRELLGWAIVIGWKPT
jgi:SAM-dependent methyltransferase